MLGLIKKDFFMIKANLKTLLIYLAIYTVISFNGNFEMSFLLPFLCIMTFISTFSYDDFNNWNAYAVTLPSGRKNIVRSKYIATIIVSLISFIIGITISILVSMTKRNVDLEIIVSSLLDSLLAISLMVSIMYPLIFKYGSEKGRIIVFAVVFGIIGIGVLVAKVVNMTSIINIINGLDNYLLITIPIVSVILLGISYLISNKIYKNREF